MNVMPPSIAAWTSRVDSRSVFGRPRCQPPSARIETGTPARPNGRVGTSFVILPIATDLPTPKARSPSTASDVLVTRREPFGGCQGRRGRPHVPGAPDVRKDGGEL